MTNVKNKNSLDESSMHNDNDLQLTCENNEEKACLCEEPLNHPEEQEIFEEASKEKKQSPQLSLFLQALEKFSNTEAKVKHALEFMENSLAQSGTPHFRSFWEVRSICLELFKENLSPAQRAQFWEKYTELSKEARRLKEILDEQSSFASEQIEKAIAALENDIARFEEQVVKLELPDLSGMPSIFTEKTAFYIGIQKRLNLLNVQASRINAMRKELIKTEIRVRQKNKFFQRLSQAGDQVFPLRKELIKEVSHAFSEDVDTFIRQRFTENFQDSLFVLREEIKGLQGFAKVITLNTHAFTHTRMCLSECWDKIKKAEKERKKERAQLKAIFKQNCEEVQEKIQVFRKRYENGELSDDHAHKQLDEISKFMRHVELGRDEIKTLRDDLSAARNLLLEKVKVQEQIRLQHEQEREKQRKTKIDELKNAIEQLNQQASSINAQELIIARNELVENIQNASLNKVEKQEIDRLLKPLRSAISDALVNQEEHALLSLSADERQAVEQLKEVLKQRKERRQEIKEALRKMGGTSGLDFEKAMANNELINTEKDRLEKINQGIKEIEDKITQLQKKR